MSSLAVAPDPVRPSGPTPLHVPRPRVGTPHARPAWADGTPPPGGTWAHDSVQGTLALAHLPVLDPPEIGCVEPGSCAGDWIAVPADLRTKLEQWTRRHLQGAVEVAAGDRPAMQLMRWCTSEVHHNLVRRASLVAHAGGHTPGQGRPAEALRPQVVSVRLQIIALDCYEACAHVRYGQRSRAVAARFEWRRKRWVNVALEFA